jgi:hypothetical protein
MDYGGCCKLVQLRFQECYDLIGLGSVTGTIGTTAGAYTGLLGATDYSGDSTNFNLLVGVQHVINGGGSPSAHAIADMKTVIANGPQGATTANAIRPAGEIIGYPDCCNLVLLKLNEALVLLGGKYTGAGTGPLGIKQDTDAGDGSLTQLNNLISTLS